MRHSRNVVVLLLGCNTPEKNPSELQPEELEPFGETAEEELGFQVEVPEVSTLQDDAVELLPVGKRDFRRLDIDQLNQAFIVATGQEWTDNGGDNQFDELSMSLGKPDYFEKVTEDLSPSLLFHKFLEDAANDVCPKTVARDVLAEPGTDKIFLPYIEWEDSDSALVAQNLSYLLLRFHGRQFDAASEEVAAWSDLFYDSLALSDGNTLLSWIGVCTALIRHPDFYSL